MKTLLYAEDTEDIRDMIQFFLEKRGYSVITTRNGNEAVPDVYLFLK